MEVVLGRPATHAEPRESWLSHVALPEWVALAYFIQLAFLGLVRPIPASHRAALLLLPCVLFGAWVVETRTTRDWSRVVRHFASLGLILLGYWALGCFAGPPLQTLQGAWVQWDRGLLHDAGLQRAIESGGPIGPWILETIYLLLYTIPVASVCVLYGTGGGRQVHRFLLILFAGTFAAYALLPFVPVVSPRVAFPGTDLPAWQNPVRHLNTWLLDNMDISTSVFPSGHVAVAFSSAWGLLSTLRGRRRIWVTSLAVASLVYLATIYGRYHYAVDGLASILISLVAWRVAERFLPDEG